MSPAIETSALTKVFGQTRAVDNLELCVESGEIFGFLGPNGAGKTTTIRALLDLARPTSGIARVLGLDSHRDSVAIHRRVGYLPGDLALFGRMTARDHVERFARARALRGTGRSADVAERFELDLDRKVSELSKGSHHKVAIVLALMHEPDLLILDEPTSGLDPLMKDEFERLLRETTATGRTVFLSSHELDEVQRVADRVAIIKDGQLVSTDTVEALRRSAPSTLELSFREPVDPARFGIDGVRVVASTGTRITLEITGALGPVLRIAADLDPVNLESRHADLDEVFLDFYRDKKGGDSEP
jgi:ABC-2 type transport system ATP-binding protein